MSGPVGGHSTTSHYRLCSCRAAGATACASDSPTCPPVRPAVIPPAATFRFRLVDSAPPSAVSAGLLAAQREKHTSNAKPQAPSVMSGCFAALWLASARQSWAQRVPAFERPAGRGREPAVCKLPTLAVSTGPCSTAELQVECGGGQPGDAHFPRMTG